MPSYSSSFFDAQRHHASRSALAAVPHIVGVVRPRSVVDLGCGIGAWLAAFKAHGVTAVVGVDGPWVPRSLSYLSVDEFVPADLTTEPQLAINRRFDLAMSLEVGEHLPSDKAAWLVATLVDLAPVVLFSAAIPQQGGTSHVNEQWPDYWASLFGTHGYDSIDCLRRMIWADNNVDWYYAQNMMLFCDVQYLATHAALQAAARDSQQMPLSIVHPRNYEEKLRFLADPSNLGIRTLLRSIPAALAKSVAWRLSK